MPRSLYGKLHRRYGPKPSSAELVARSRRKQEAFARWLPLPERRRPEQALSVIVVGGGFAGLAAGWLLNQTGAFDVTVLESRDRVGGRVLTFGDVPPGRYVEAGAELIGMNHPTWLTLARRFGLGLSVLTSEDQQSAAGLEMPLHLNGAAVTDPDALYAQMTATLEQMGSDAAQIPSPYEPWLASQAATWDNMSVKTKLEQLGVKERTQLYEAIQTELENNNVLPIDQQSYLGLLSLIKGGSLDGDINAYWTATEVYRCEAGNQALAGAMSDALGSAVLLSKKVSIIYAASAPAQVYVNGEPGPRYADYVILAIPPSLWPPLTVTPSIADAAMSMGPAIKYLSPLGTRYWIQNGQSPSGMSDEFGMTWEGTDNQMNVGGAYELSVFAGGSSANHALKVADPVSYFTGKLEAYLPGYTANLDGAPYFAAWPDDPDTLSGYSCPSVGQVTTVAPLLVQPKGQLYFAGEHACMAFYGYMEGALQSGLFAAWRVLEAAGLLSPDLPRYPELV